MLLTDFDASRQAVINPDMLFSPVPDLPATVVSCFSHVTFERMLDMAADVRVLAELGDANAKYPIYRGLWQGTPLTFALAMVGAPSCVAMLEELHALGAKRFVVFGNCGVLNQQIRDCGIIIPTAAVRDEGTSFHYAPPSDEIPANPKYRGEKRAWTSPKAKCGRRTPSTAKPAGRWHCARHRGASAWIWSARR